MDDKKKKFIVPEAEIFEFENNDIITTSGTDTSDWKNGGGDGFDWLPKGE